MFISKYIVKPSLFYIFVQLSVSEWLTSHLYQFPLVDSAYLLVSLRFSLISWPLCHFSFFLLPHPSLPILSISLILFALPYLVFFQRPCRFSSSLIKAGNKPPPATPGKPKKATTFQEFESITSDAWDVGDDDDELLAMAAQNLNIEVVMETANKVNNQIQLSLMHAFLLVQCWSRHSCLIHKKYICTLLLYSIWNFTSSVFYQQI